MYIIDIEFELFLLVARIEWSDGASLPRCGQKCDDQFVRIWERGGYYNPFRDAQSYVSISRRFMEESTPQAVTLPKCSC